MEITVEKNELYGLIKEAVREVMHEETLELYLKNISSVSKEEMEDIEKLYSKPSKDKKAIYSEKIKI